LEKINQVHRQRNILGHPCRGRWLGKGKVETAGTEKLAKKQLGENGVEELCIT